MARNTLFDSVYEGSHLSRQEQARRVRKVMELELTPIQREVIVAYFVENKSMPQIARERGVNKSTICRNLHRGMGRIRRCLRY